MPSCTSAPAAPRAVFAAVTDEAGRLLGADIAAIDRFDSDDMVTLVAVHGTADPVIWLATQPELVEDPAALPRP